MSVKRPQKEESVHSIVSNILRHMHTFNEIIASSAAHIYEKIIWFHAEEKKTPMNDTESISLKRRE